jgi:hypothetical protein
VHFSTTPRILGATSGFKYFSVSAGHTGSHQLKQRTIYGQAAMQYRQPMHRVFI